MVFIVGCGVVKILVFEVYEECKVVVVGIAIEVYLGVYLHYRSSSSLFNE